MYHAIHSTHIKQGNINLIMELKILDSDSVQRSLVVISYRDYIVSDGGYSNVQKGAWATRFPVDIEQPAPGPMQGSSGTAAARLAGAKWLGSRRMDQGEFPKEAASSGSGSVSPSSGSGSERGKSEALSSHHPRENSALMSHHIFAPLRLGLSLSCPLQRVSQKWLSTAHPQLDCASLAFCSLRRVLRFGMR